jgi:hypothetical protein
LRVNGQLKLKTGMIDSLSRPTPLLQQFRRRLRYAWMLHGYLISTLILMPFGRQGRADEEDVFTQTGEESQVVVGVWAPAGTSGLVPGAERQVLISVQRHTWEVWTGSVSGTIQLRNERITPVSADLQYTVPSGYGSVWPGTGSTDANGAAATTFTMGTGATALRVEASYDGGAVAVGTLDFSAPDPEEWTYVRTESFLAASLTTTGSTENVASTETRQVRVHAESSSWDVYTSSWGNTETRNPNSSPASGAQISWSVVTGGDGAIVNDWQTSPTDGSGDATATFTMGAGASVVRADVLYGGSTATNASITFTPPPAVEQWSHYETLTSLSSVTLSASGPVDGVLPGVQTPVTATVMNYVREGWVSTFGNYEVRYPQYIPAESVPVVVTLESGDGSVSVGSGTTDSSGAASTVFTMGSQASRIRADAAYSPGGPMVSGTLEFNPFAEVWSFVSSTSELSVSLSPNGPVDDVFPGASYQLTADVVNTTWEVWTSNLGNTDHRTFTAPAAGLSVAFVVQSGEGTLSATSRTTNPGGQATVGFTMGTLSTTVRADVTDVGGVVRSGTTDFTAHVEQWTRGPDEATISTSVTADGSTTEVSSGTMRSITAQVMYTNWEVWTSDLGRIDKRYESTGAANGATVTFSVDQGNGTISGAGTSTDADGKAYTTFTMDSQDSRVRADASYAGATSAGSLNFSRDPWTHERSASAVTLSLSAAPASSTVTADVALTTWEVWKRIPGGQTENRNPTSGPAEGAAVSFSESGGISIGSGSGTTDVTGKATTSYSGSPGATGLVSVVVWFTERTASGSIEITVPQPPDPGPGPGPDPGPGPGPATLTITTPSLEGTVGTPAAGSLGASGGSGYYTWTAGGAGGLSWDETGAISGTPTYPGNYTATLEVAGGGMASKTVPVTITAPLDPDPEPPEPTPLINASSTASIGFSNDHPLHYVGADGQSHAIDPNDETPLVGPGSDSAATAAVAYTKGSTPRTFAQLIVTRGTPSDDPMILDPSEVEWRLKANGVAIASGNSPLGVGPTVIDLESHPFSAPLRSTPGSEILDVTVEVMYTGYEIINPVWGSGGGANIPCYCTDATPITPDGLRLVELYAAIFPPASSSAMASGSSSAAPGASASNANPVTPQTIMAEIDKEYVYNGGVQPLPAIVDSTSGAFNPGPQIKIEFARPDATCAHQCSTHAYTLEYLAKQAGFTADARCYWGGKLGEIHFYYHNSNPVSLQVRPRPIYEDSVEANPFFTFHAITQVKGIWYDPSFYDVAYTIGADPITPFTNYNVIQGVNLRYGQYYEYNALRPTAIQHPETR